MATIGTQFNDAAQKLMAQLQWRTGRLILQPRGTEATLPG